MLFQLSSRAGLDGGSRHLLRRVDATGIWWAAGTGLIYFCAAWLSLPFATPQGISPFWPAAGVAVGSLLAAGSSARLHLAAAIAIASFLANWLGGRPVPLSIVFALGNTGEALTVAALGARWIEPPFQFDRLKSVLGLFASAVLGTAAWQALTAVAIDLAGRSASGVGQIWELLVWSNFTGIVVVAPVVTGLVAAIRKPPPPRVTVEGCAVLIIHALASAYAFGLLPFEFARWMQISPLSSQLLVLLWLAVRAGPLFAAAGTMVLGVVMLCSFSMQHSIFANTAFPISDRLLTMHFAMLAISFMALAIAALIAERRDAEMCAKHNETRLKLSLESGSFGTWELEPESGIFEGSSRTISNFGLPTRMPAPFSKVTETLHPADRQLFESQIQRVARGEGNLDSECRVLAPDGSVRWLHVIGRATGDDADGPRIIAGAVRDITEHKSIASLKESVEQLRLFVEQAPVAIAMFDRQLRYIAASQRWMTSYRLSQRGLVGLPVDAAAPGMPKVWKEVLRRALSGEVLSGEQDPAVFGDGQTRWLRWEARPWREPDGVIGGIVIFTDDVTSRVKAERALRESREDLDRAQAVARTGSWRLDARTNALSWSAETYRIFGIPLGTALTYQSFLAAVHPEDRDFVDKSWKAAAFSGAAYDIEHRILARGEIKWVRERAELEFDAAGKLLGGFGTVQDITDKKLAEQELLRLQRLTQLISDRAADAIFLTDQWGQITYANPEASRLFEYEPKEMLGQGLHDLLHHHYAGGAAFPRDDCPLARLQDSGATIRNYEDVFFRKDGSPIDVSCSFAPLERETSHSGGVFVVRDISAQKAAQAALRESEERLRLSNEAAGIGAFTLDLENKRAYYSQELADMLGCPDVLAAGIDEAFSRVHRDDLARVRNQFNEGIKSGGRIKMEFRFVRSGGEVRWMTWIARVDSREEQGKRVPFRVFGVGVDITERKRADEAAAQLAAIVASSSDAIIGTSVDGIVTSWNEGARRLFRYTSEEMIGQPLSRLIPADLQEEENAVLAMAATGGAIATQEALRIDSNGRPIEVSISVSPVRDGSGKIIGVSRIARDISRRKRAEEALRESEERFRSIVSTAMEAIVVVDEEGRMQSINPAAERMFGYNFEEIAGKDISMLMPEPHRADHPGHLESYRRTGINHVIGRGKEMNHLRKDGTEFPAELTVAEWRAGGKRYFTGIMRDITERKRHEEKVQLLLREVNHRAKNMLALVQAIASRTAAPDHEEFMKRFSERLSALAASQDLLVGSGWQGVEVEALVRSQLSHFKSLIDDRIKLKGQQLKLSAPSAQTIGMALHELATNAGKYGALSCGAGSIEIGWRLSKAEAGDERFEMMWVERGGPEVSLPTRAGFGSTVIEAIPRMELDAEVTLDFAPEGLRWRLDCPSKSVLEKPLNGGEAGQQ